MKKRLVLTLGAFLLLWVLFPIHAVLAHFSKIDKNITVVFHVDPNDDPTPGEQATLYFLFDDRTKKFNLAECHCIVTVTEQGKQISSQPLIGQKNKKPSIWGADLPYSFPRRDVYQITLNGSPIVPNAFQTFTLSWNFRVDQYPQGSQSYTQQSDPTFIYFAIGFLSIPVVFGIGLFLLIRF